MLKKIYKELVEIKKELQAIRSSLEPKKLVCDITNGNTDNLVIENADNW